RAIPARGARHRAPPGSAKGRTTWESHGQSSPSNLDWPSSRLLLDLEVRRWDRVARRALAPRELPERLEQAQHHVETEQPDEHERRLQPRVDDAARPYRERNGRDGARVELQVLEGAEPNRRHHEHRQEHGDADDGPRPGFDAEPSVDGMVGHHEG